MHLGGTTELSSLDDQNNLPRRRACSRLERGSGLRTPRRHIEDKKRDHRTRLFDQVKTQSVSAYDH